MSTPTRPHKDALGRMVDGLIRFCLENKLIVFLVFVSLFGWALMTMPFDYEVPYLPREPIPVDALPNIGENQQIVFTEWPGRSPQDIEDQITYPLTVSLLGVPGVKTIRSHSYFGFSSVYVVFEDDVEFYWSRSRILERLSVAQRELPEGVTPTLGPDATALGQIYWYTLEGRDPETGEVVGGWDLEELRSIQDWYVRYSLQSAEGVSEVASVGGFVREYQVDVDPDAMRAYDVTLDDVYRAIMRSNIDVGARTIEINRVEYVLRGLGFIEKVEDLENTVIKSQDHVPIYLKNVADIATGPAMRRGVLDKGGAEAVGGVVVVRYDENPLETIKNVKQKIQEIAPGLPEKRLADGRLSKVTIVPFYDRTELIHETLGTLGDALSEEILVTILVVIAMVWHLRSSLMISSLLPLAVLFSFIAMKLFDVNSNIMSLTGIAIAIGTMVDMGVILCENILRHLEESEEEDNRLEVIFRAASEVGRPVLTAILTTIISFLPVFAMVGQEGKMFKPLAFTKTFALFSSILVALTFLPPLAHVLFHRRFQRHWIRWAGAAILLAGAGYLMLQQSWWLAGALVLWAGSVLGKSLLPKRVAGATTFIASGVAFSVVLVFLTEHWMPLGIGNGLLRNLIFVGTMIVGILAVFLIFLKLYEPILRFFLAWKIVFYLLPMTTVLIGLIIWLGFSPVFAFVPKLASLAGIDEERIRSQPAWVWMHHQFPGLGEEFMPDFDEGSYLLMPTTMPHASIGEALDVLQKQDRAIMALPEVREVVGKIGRVESPLDPAPISMVETVIHYHPVYLLDEHGKPKLFAHDPDEVDFFRSRQGKRISAEDGAPYKVRGKFLRDQAGELIPQEGGHPFRLWRPALDPAINPGREAWAGVQDPRDIWNLIEEVSHLPGTTGASELQPIEARQVMLQTGVRAPMAVRVLGDDLREIEETGLQIESLLKEVPGVAPATVFADRLVGKPYLEIDIDRKAIARYGLNIRDIQNVIETAIGGRKITTMFEGRERYPIRARYKRELRDSIQAIRNILVAAPDGTQIPMKELTTIRYVRGPQAIKSENTRLVGYVIFNKKKGYAEVEVVENARKHLEEAIANGGLSLPPGVAKPTFIGSYQNQVRSAKTLAVVVPLALFLIFIILFLQFRAVGTTLLIFAGVFVAFSGGFLMLGLYSTDWFLNFSVFGVDMRDLFHVTPYNLSVAVWVGFIALLGIATDDGVVIASYLSDSFRENQPRTKQEIRDATVQAGLRRIRPCLMTTATTILALLPILTSDGRGSDLMVPMAIPSFGGMSIALITLFFVPVSFCLLREIELKSKQLKKKIT
jgi:Cu(I)/Ag(I) efflux system membrane protein CusA/SilA